MGCPAMKDTKNIVWIRPIVTRKNGIDRAELGVGGGGYDFIQNTDLEISADDALQQLLNL